MDETELRMKCFELALSIAPNAFTPDDIGLKKIFRNGQLIYNFVTAFVPDRERDDDGG
jgi:hypothetical protein